MPTLAKTPGLDWLIARPIAHRGLHGLEPGVIENTAGAFQAAISAGYAIETDLQISADGEAMVHHDEALGRLTEGQGRLAELPAARIQAVRYKASGERIMTLGELCELVAEQVTLVIELKSFYEHDTRLAQRTAAVLQSYRGPVAVMSFDPQVVESMRIFSPQLARGLVAERHGHDRDRQAVPAARKRQFAGFRRARPQFIAYAIKDLPAFVPLFARSVIGLPLLTWTVRTAEDRKRAARYADQMIFEGFRP